MALAADDVVQVANPDEIGMGHGKMGWRAAKPGQFFSGAAERNKAFIGEALSARLGGLGAGTVLEVGSGSGQHVVHFAARLPGLRLLPTEYPGHPNPAAEPQELGRILASIDGTVAESGLTNVAAAGFLDASALASWGGAPDGSLSAVVCVNVVHISPPPVTDGLLAGASVKLQAGGFLFLYGPYARDGVIEPESNVKFDQALREKNPEFGLRDITVVRRRAAELGMQMVDELFAASSNNWLLCIRKG